MVAVGLPEDYHDAVRVINRLSDLLFVVARNADGENRLSKEG